MSDNKKQHTIRVDDATWDALTVLADKDDDYRGRLSQGRVIERLVEAAMRPAPPQPPPPPPPPTPVQPEPRQAPAVVAPQQWRLADVVAKWPDKVQKQWAADGWKAKWWVEQVLETINAGRG